MKSCLAFFIVLALASGFSACSAADYTSFHSERYDIDVELPLGWAVAEGPGDLGIIHQAGLLAFNSWGEAGFWAQATRNVGPDGSISQHYSPYVVASRVPSGGAYVALTEFGGQPPPVDQPEYTLNDLSGLYEPHDWRQENGAYFKTFYMGGSTDLRLEVACSQNATDETVARINALLKSWRLNS